MSRRKQITNPVDRALEAYFELDSVQKMDFRNMLERMEQFAEKLGHSAGLPAPTVKRGRPLGSKTKPKANSGYSLEELQGINAAAEEGL